MRTPSPAMVVALLALFISLCGTGLAATHYLITSVNQIAPKVNRRAYFGHDGKLLPVMAAVGVILTLLIRRERRLQRIGKRR